METTTKITLSAEKESLKKLNLFVEKFVEKINLSPKTLFNLYLIIEEIVVNICSYSYPNGNGDFSLEIFYENNNITLIFEDSGIEFDPTQKKDNFQHDIEKARIGGLGISIVKQLAKSIEYKRIAGKNILKIIVYVGE